MVDKDTILNGIENDIKKILFAYIKAESFTNTSKEKEVEKFFINYFSNIDYFKNTPNSFGTYSIENDAFDRSVCYAFLKGDGEDTIVFVHHSDVVGVEDFKLLKEFAFTPEELKRELLKIKDTLNEEIKKDLVDDTFLFGRGVCDMKGGGAIQIALLKRYSQLKDFKGNIVLIAVPDEENLSAGMRAAVKLLHELKREYNLNYKIMINSEPHQRKDLTKGVFSEGSVGKLMPFVYIRGALAHAGKVFEGLNPLSIMSNIVRKTELNIKLSDTAGYEASPPPTWLYLKDGKKQYDVSMPLSVKGCFSILTLHQTPQSVLKIVKDICVEAFDEVIYHMNKSYSEFTKITKIPHKDLPWKTKVVNFYELYQEAENTYGEKFTRKYDDKMLELSHNLKYNKVSIIEANFDLIEFIYGFGLIIKMAEITLAVHYRSKDENNEAYGGPNYYIKKGLGEERKLPKIAKALSFIFAFGFLTGYFINIQTYTVAEAIANTFELGMIPVAIVYTIVLYFMISGGISSLGRIAAKIVPFMCIFYLLGGLFIIFKNMSALPSTLQLIFGSAFTGIAAFGGFLGATFSQAIKLGMSRSVFSNEAGWGSAPMIHATAKVDHPIKQGLMGIFEVFVDTFIVCSITALVIIMTGQWSSGLDGATLTLSAFESGLGRIGRIILAVGVFLFGITTSSGVYAQIEVVVRYLIGNTPMKKSILSFYKWTYPIPSLLMVIIAVYMRFPGTTVWIFSDASTALPIFANIITLFVLTPKFVELINDYKARYLGVGTVDPDYKLFYDDKVMSKNI